MARARAEKLRPAAQPADPDAQLIAAAAIEAWARRTARPGEWFDERAAEKACEFFPRYLRHTEGEWAALPFHLSPWERSVVRTAWGWKRPDGTRRFREIYIEIPRKNGKTEFAAGLMLLILLGDGEFGGQVYSTAVDKDQAKIAFNKAALMVSLCNELKDELTVFKTSIFSPELNAKIAPLSSVVSSKHGFSPTGRVSDEIHEWPHGDLADVVHKGCAARRQPMEIEITTAGLKNRGYGWERHDHAVKVLAGEKDDHELLPIIFAASDDDDWTQPSTWHKANPGLGVSPKYDFIERECRNALGNPRKENDFKRFHLNLWTEQITRWIPLHVWDSNSLERKDPLRWQKLEKLLRGRACYSGLDLASVRDTTSLVHVFPPIPDADPTTLEGRLAILWRCWVPKDNVPEIVGRTRMPWEEWAKLGAVNLTPGNITDYRAIKLQYERDAEQFQMQEIAIDRWNASQVAVELQEDGATVAMFGQGFASMSAPAKEFERLLFGQLIEHGNHPVARWMMANTAISQDAAGNIKPDKDRSNEKIDLIVGGIMGIGRAMVAETPLDIGGLIRAGQLIL